MLWSAPDKHQRKGHVSLIIERRTVNGETSEKCVLAFQATRRPCLLSPNGVCVSTSLKLSSKAQGTPCGALILTGIAKAAEPTAEQE